MRSLPAPVFFREVLSGLVLIAAILIVLSLEVVFSPHA
jgi:hypothetical protein